MDTENLSRKPNRIVDLDDVIKAMLDRACEREIDARLAYNRLLERFENERERRKQAERQPRPAPTLPEAMEVLKRELNNDKGYRQGWVDNIAMSFKDCYQWDFKDRNPDLAAYPGLSDGELNRIHRVANRAANYFLNLLTGANNAATAKMTPSQAASEIDSINDAKPF